MKLLNIAKRNIGRNKKRSALSIVATAIATAAIVFMFAYLEGMFNNMHDSAFNYDTGEIIIRNNNYDEKVFSLDRAIDNYKNVLNLIMKEFPNAYFSPRIEFPSTTLDGELTHMSFGLAVDMELEEKYLNLSDKLVGGSIPIKPRDVLIGAGLADELKLKVGDKFTPITATRLGASSGITFTVSGIAKFGNPKFDNKTFICPLVELPTMLKMRGSVSNIIIKGIGDKYIDETVLDINRMLQEKGYLDIEAYSWKNVGLNSSMIDMAGGVYDIVAIFFFLLSSSVIANTMLMVVFERRKEIGTVTAMGMTSIEVVRLFFLEALILGVLGSSLGVLIGVVSVLPLSIIGLDLSSASEGVDLGISFLIYPQISIRSTLVVFLYSVFVASFVSFFPSRSAAKVDPVVALRSL